MKNGLELLCRSLLDESGHGILSMGKDSRGDGIPRSFGYADADE